MQTTAEHLWFQQQICIILILKTLCKYFVFTFLSQLDSRGFDSPMFFLPVLATLTSSYIPKTSTIG